MDTLELLENGAPGDDAELLVIATALGERLLAESTGTAHTGAPRLLGRGGSSSGGRLGSKALEAALLSAVVLGLTVGDNTAEDKRTPLTRVDGEGRLLEALAWALDVGLGLRAVNGSKGVGDSGVGNSQEKGESEKEGGGDHCAALVVSEERVLFEGKVDGSVEQ